MNASGPGISMTMIAVPIIGLFFLFLIGGLIALLSFKSTRPAGAAALVLLLLVGAFLFVGLFTVRFSAAPAPIVTYGHEQVHEYYEPAVRSPQPMRPATSAPTQSIQQPMTVAPETLLQPASDAPTTTPAQPAAVEPATATPPATIPPAATPPAATPPAATPSPTPEPTASTETPAVAGTTGKQPAAEAPPTSETLPAGDTPASDTLVPPAGETPPASPITPPTAATAEKPVEPKLSPTVDPSFTPPVSPAPATDTTQSNPPAASAVRPAWVDAPPHREQNVYRVAVKSGLYVTTDECDRALAKAMQKAVDAYIDDYLEDGAAQLIAIDPQYIQHRIRRELYHETAQASVGQMQQLYGLLVFDDDVRNLFQQRWRQTLIQRRLWQVGAGSAAVLGLIGTLFGFLSWGQKSAQPQLVPSVVAEKSGALAAAPSRFWLHCAVVVAILIGILAFLA